MVKDIQELLRGDQLEAAHRALVKLIRTNKRDPEVNFLLALVRKRLRYDISAEALFQRAFDLGFMPTESLEADSDQEASESTDPAESNRKRWTDASGEVSLLLRLRPRVKLFEFLGFAPLPQS